MFGHRGLILSASLLASGCFAVTDASTREAVCNDESTTLLQTAAVKNDELDARKPEKVVGVEKPTFKIGGRHIDFALLESPGSRLVLALGLPAVLTPFHERKLQVFYLEEKTETNVLGDAFKLGGSGLVVDSTEKIAFADLNFDIVVVGSGWCGGSCDRPSVDEYLRVLRPSGKLLFWESKLGAVQNHPLVAPTAFQNFFVRAEKNVRGLPFCKMLKKESNESLAHAALVNGEALGNQQGESCQPYVSNDYVSVDALSRRLHFGTLLDLSVARLTHQHIENAAHPDNEEQATFVTDRLQDAINGSKWYSEQYLGKKMVPISPIMGDTWSFPTEHQGWESRHTEWIRSGKVKNLLDAGAGTCSIDALLRQLGLSPTYVGYGFYDQSMARVCAERGSLIFDWDWGKKLPICKDCAYDMVFQSGGMHHAGKECKKQTRPVDCAKQVLQAQLDSFDGVLKCGGNLVMHDFMTHFVQGNGTSEEKMTWSSFAKTWAGEKKYVVENVSPEAGDNQVEITKQC